MNVINYSRLDYLVGIDGAKRLFGESAEGTVGETPPEVPICHDLNEIVDGLT